MKRSLQVDIPQPCHENWNNMTDTDLGRFCKGCQKEVVDFSKMTDEQLHNYLSQSKSHLCGRFRNDQLGREIRSSKAKRTIARFYWNLIIPFILFFSKGSAQYRLAEVKTECVPLKPKEPTIMLQGTVGMVVSKPISKLFRGKITDRDGRALPGASILIKATKLGTVTDRDGNYQIELPENGKAMVLVLSYVGYITREISVRAEEIQKEIFETKLEQVENMLGEVVTAGMIIVKPRKSFLPLLKRPELKSEIHAPRLKLFPDPVIAGKEVNVQFENIPPGDYTIILSDINGNALLRKDVRMRGTKQLEILSLQGSYIAGMYTLRLINRNGKRMAGSGLVIQ